MLLRPFCSATALFALLLTSASGGAGGWIVGWGNNVGGQATGFPAVSLPLPPSERIGELSAATGAVTVAGCEVSNATAIAAGPFHSLAVRSDGTVAGWGSNQGGQAVGFLTGRDTGTNGEVVIDGQPLVGVASVSAAHGLSLALLTNGLVRVWGIGPEESGTDQFAPPKGLEGVVAAAVGYRHAVAALRDGTVVAWGPFGSLRERLTNVMAVAASPDWAGRDMALRRDGTVMEWDVRLGVPSRVPGLSNIVAISSGYGHQLALRSDGTVVGLGGNRQGEATGKPTEDSVGPALVSLNGSPLREVVSIAAGREYSLALRRDGTVAAWGRWHGLRPIPVPLGLSNVVAIAAGPDFCIAITTNRAVADRFSP